MGTQTQVSIFEVGPLGGTGRQVGRGTLIQPQVVLIHAPLSDSLAANGMSDRLRVAIAWRSQDAELSQDVIDSAQLGAADNQGDAALVAVYLSRITAAPPESLPQLTGHADAEDVKPEDIEGLTTALRGIARRTNPAVSTHTLQDQPFPPDDGRNRRIICALFPDFPGCRN